MKSGGKEGENRNRSHYSELRSYSAKTYALTGKNTHTCTHAHILDNAISLSLGRIFLPILMERIIRRHKRKQTLFCLLVKWPRNPSLLFSLNVINKQKTRMISCYLFFFTMPRIAYILRHNNKTK